MVLCALGSKAVEAVVQCCGCSNVEAMKKSTNEFLEGMSQSCCVRGAPPGEQVGGAWPEGAEQQGVRFA